MDERSLIQEKVQEYLSMSAPLDRAEAEVALARRMLRARTEEELHEIAPALRVLSESLDVSTLDMLLAEDRITFIHRAMERSGMSLHELRSRLIESSSTAHEELKLLGFGETL